MFQLFKKHYCAKIFVFLLLSSVGLYAEETAAITDDKPHWSVGVSRFKGIDLGEENTYLTMNLPHLILEKIQLCKDHHLSQGEKDGYRRKLLDNLIDSREKELHTLMNERDKIFFSQNRSEKTLQTYNEKLKEIRDQIAKLKNYPLENIEVEDKKTVSVVKKDNNVALLEEMAFSPAYMAQANALDMYIYGSIEKIEDYFFLNVHVWNNILGEHQLEIKDAASRTDMQKLGERVSAQIIRAAIGSDWAMLSIEVSAEDADIYIDGEYWGSGRLNEIIVEPGMHVIDIMAEQYGDRRIEYYVQETKKNKLSVELEEKDIDSVQIDSFPFGADVYADSRWIGRTPVSIPKTGKLKRIFVKAPMYNTAKLTLSPETPDEIFLRLSPFKMDTEKYIGKKRDEFYRAAGLFVLTFPLPFFLYSMSEDFAAGYVIASQNNDTDGMNKNLNRSAVAYHSYIGSLVIVTSMLINTVVNLAEYIIAGES